MERATRLGLLLLIVLLTGLPEPPAVAAGAGLRTVPSERVAGWVRDYLQRTIPWPAEDVEIRQLAGLRDLRLPAGRYTYTVRPRPGEDFLGRTPLEVTVQPAHGRRVRFWVTAEIAVLAPVVVARHPLARFREIGPSDVTVERRDLAGVPRDACRSVDEVVGKRTRTAVGAGETLARSRIEAPPLVRRGDRVTVTVENDRLRVTTMGEVLENGRAGDRIRVRNLRSRKELYGEVVDQRTVRVVY